MSRHDQAARALGASKAKTPGRRVRAVVGAAGFSDLADLSMQRYAHQLLLARIWELRYNVTAYDAAYLALAEALDAPLPTRDARLTGATGHGARIEVL